MALKLFCDICVQKFNTDEEEIEHFCSLAHHIKQSRAQPTSKRVCMLCQTIYDTLADYSRHLDSDPHARVRERFRKNVASSSGRSNKQPRSSGASSSNSARPPSSSASLGMRHPPCLPTPLFSVNKHNYSGFGRGSCMVSPPWYPPCLPQSLEFRAGNNFADDSFSDYMLTFQPPPPAKLTVPYVRPAATDSTLVPRPLLPSADNSGVGSSAPMCYRLSNGMRTSTRRVLLQSPDSFIEPDVPLDVRHLAQSDRRIPTTWFTKKKQREEFFRSKPPSRRNTPSSNPAKDSVAKMKTKLDGRKKRKRLVDRNADDEPREVSKTILPLDAIRSKGIKAKKVKKKRLFGPDAEGERTKPGAEETHQRQQLEADSTTTTTESLHKRKTATGASLAASLLKRRRLIAKAQRISDRLLADRLNRYRVVAAAGRTTNTGAPSSHSQNGAAGSCGSLSAPLVSKTADGSNTPARIDATVRQRARSLFMDRVLSAVACGRVDSETSISTTTITSCTKTEAVPSPPLLAEDGEKDECDLREPKVEKPIENEAARPSSRTPTSANPRPKTGSEMNDEQPGSSDVTSTSATPQEAPMPALQELWCLCKLEEQIRSEEARVNDEMERLKLEMQRVWYRQKELQQKAAECAKRKRILLEGVQEDGERLA